MSTQEVMQRLEDTLDVLTSIQSRALRIHEFLVGGYDAPKRETSARDMPPGNTAGLPFFNRLTEKEIQIHRIVQETFELLQVLGDRIDMGPPTDRGSTAVRSSLAPRDHLAELSKQYGGGVGGAGGERSVGSTSR